MPTVDVTIPVDEAAAAEFETPEQRARIGRLVTQLLRPSKDVDLLEVLLEKMSRNAAARGLTDEEVDAELAAHKAERRR